MTGGNVNSATLERHLKKIYDCLNIGCNKKAVQEVDRLPKNVRDLTVFKALKSLALIRMYKKRQAFDILDEINPEDELDEVTLQTMTSCYKESVDVGKIVDLYEAALRRKPADLEIMAHLFMAYVRVFNFKRQKEVALQMFKSLSKKKRLYTFWAIMSLVMQSQEKCGLNELPDRKVCLSLAEKMCVNKVMDDERTHEEIELYLIILRKQNKHEEEYKFLTGPICARITDHLSWFNRRRAYLCLELKMYSRAFKHYFPTLIQEYPDQFEYYTGLFKAAFLLDTEPPSQQSQTTATNDQQAQSMAQPAGTPVKSSSALAECYEIVEKQCQLAVDSLESSKDHQRGKTPAVVKNVSRTSSLNPNTTKRLLRGPFLARINLYATIWFNESKLPKNIYTICMNQFASKFPKFTSILADYFQTFSKKLICYYDMDSILNEYSLSYEDIQDFMHNIKTWTDGQTDMNPLNFFHVRLNHNLLKHTLRDYQVSDKTKDRLVLAKEYIDMYDENRDYGKDVCMTEFLPVDHYCLLAINSIMINSVDLQDLTSQSILSDTILISLIVMAETAIANSPSNHQLKLILLKLYSFIGASKQSSEILLALDIKHFQIDTLGHLLNPVLYNTGNYSLSRESLETCLEFYSRGARECFEGLTTSYRDGRFSKVEEISSVLSRLSDSLNATQCVLLKAIVANISAGSTEELMTACQSSDLKSLHRLFCAPELADTIKDSRDFKVLRSLHFSTNKLIQQRQLETLEDEKLWLRLRYYLLKSSFTQLECFAGNQKRANGSVKLDDLDDGRREFETLVAKMKELSDDCADKRYSYLEPEASPFRWKHLNLDALLNLVKPIVFCSSLQSLTPQVQEDYLLQLDTIICDLETQLTSINSFVTMKQALLSLTISIEFIALCITSLISIVQIESTTNHSTNSHSSGSSAKSASSQQQQQITTKSKMISHLMVSKTEIQLAKLSNIIRAVDPKSLIFDKISRPEQMLLSDTKHTSLTIKNGAPLQALMGQEAVQVTLQRVKDKVLNGYMESLKEIEGACRRKVKMLRAKT